jgi:ASC-1-like (ASCH) protein
MDDMKQQAMIEETRSVAEGLRGFYAAYTKQREEVFVVSGLQ